MSAFSKAVALIVGGDKSLWFVINTSLRFSFWSTIFSVLPGLPLAFMLFLMKGRLRNILAAIVNAIMALPTVVIGLFVYSAISNRGPLGSLKLLFAPGGVIIGQSLLALPLVIAMTYTGFQKLDPRYHETLTTLGAGLFSKMAAIMREGRYVILQAALSAFGRVTGEVGVSMMLGGNIKGYTRTMTTSVALEISKGEFEYALALGLILLIVALLINVLSHLGIRND